MKRRPNFVDLSDASGTAQHAPALLFAALGAAGRRFTPTTSPFGSKADLLCECAPSFGVVRRNHRIIFWQIPFRPVFIGRDAIVSHQVAAKQIGRASCREGVWQYASLPVGSAASNTKWTNRVQ